MDSIGRKIGLALSGGGYRAAAYHIGTLRALHKERVLDKIDIISSVSGGSITSAYYALNKDDYATFENGLIESLKHGVMKPVWFLLVLSLLLICVLSFGVGLMGYFYTRDVSCSILIGFILWILVVTYMLLRWYNYMPISKLISCGYDKLFFQGKCLKDLPESPVITINSTNIATCLPFSFSHNYMGEYAYTVNKKSIFSADNFPISTAVMASSCVPYGFTPIRIEEKYLTNAYTDCKTNPEPPLLVDGGIYDNQGAHKLSENKSRYHCDLIIVSDAGNGDIRAEGTDNFIVTLYKTSEMMMDRIKKLQVIHNIYEGHQDHSHYVYAPLAWNCGDALVSGFARNLQEGNIHPDVWQKHGFTDAEVDDYVRNPNQEKTNDICRRLKESINWDVLIKNSPSEKSEKTARRVGTNLTALSESQIRALVAHSEWITTVQLRLYMPNL